MKDKKELQVTGKYQDVGKNAVNFNGKITMHDKSEGNRKNLPMLITEWEDIKLVLGMHWLRKIKWTMRHIEKSLTPNDEPERDEIVTQFEKLSRQTKQLKVQGLKYN